MDTVKYVTEKAKLAKRALRVIANASSDQKNRALKAMATLIIEASAELLAANQTDIAAAEKNGLSRAMIDRLALNEKRITSMAKGLREVAALPDPVGEITQIRRRPNGMEVGRMRVPLGLIGIIYESRPNVTVEAAALCFKAGNSVILRGGSESIKSNAALAQILSKALAQNNLPQEAIAFIEYTDRACVNAMLKLDEYIDLIIPRGGHGLIRAVTENSTIPVIKHDKGVCHVYVDEHADLSMAEAICINAKTQRPSTCNAMETMLVHEKIAPQLLPSLAKKFAEKGVKIYACEQSRAWFTDAEPADDSVWYNEYNDMVLNVKVVPNFTAAVDHIATYSSQHTDTIVTQDYARARRFLREVDSAAVMVNVSTRFSDGFEFGMGAEIGISTTRLHARGPMGLEELTCNKFIVMGDGQLRT
ncbi:MAG: glutamate-5-semialdehyde dehydrogenase [Deltaproteobacteria bacterium]|nr:glutamate-5-semialdehyde dehydrogenase [Deltaproteobacteria bacterium]